MKLKFFLAIINISFAHAAVYLSDMAVDGETSQITMIPVSGIESESSV